MELTPDQTAHIDNLVDHFRSQKETLDVFLQQLFAVSLHPTLKPLIHSVKGRVKDASHLKAKLERKAVANPDAIMSITRETLGVRITDLVGIRLIHLHTQQMREIHRVLLALFENEGYKVLETFARVWDHESQKYFVSLGIETQSSENLYTSVHYVVETGSKSKRTAEIQVRTLADELWGEVDHAINYPEKSTKLACREQLKVLARLTSGCSRLVDSIFATHKE